MGLKIRKSNNNEGASSYVKTTVLRDYPLVVVHTARTGEKAGYNNIGKQDYIVGDFIGFDAGGNAVFQEYGAMWSINRREDNTSGAIFRALHETGVYVGHIEKIKTKKGNDVNVWSDIDPDSVKAQVEKALALLEEKATDESGPAQPSSPQPAPVQDQPVLQRPW